jgi:hypothetical protein
MLSKKIDPMVLAKDEDSRLNVCVRLRPINKIEADLQNEAVWSADVDDRCAHGFRSTGPIFEIAG